jgi:hypothetical protein
MIHLALWLISTAITLAFCAVLAVCAFYVLWFMARAALYLVPVAALVYFVFIYQF